MLGAGTLVFGLFAGVIAGFATVDLAAGYGIVLALGVALKNLGRAVAEWMISVGSRAVEVRVPDEHRGEEKRMILGRGQGWERERAGAFLGVFASMCRIDSRVLTCSSSSRPSAGSPLHPSPRRLCLRSIRPSRRG